MTDHAGSGYTYSTGGDGPEREVARADCDMHDGEMRATSSLSRTQASEFSLERASDAG